ncbi:MAG: fumarylacetoacetate hydrolase family protein [Anaerolineae bacterium]|nr:fumarylacetoacetate hydrolase family protein [Anaerolineae bacterium]
MRLATYCVNQEERFGLVLPHPATGEDWVFDPARTEARLRHYAGRPTAPFYSTRPPSNEWPTRLIEFLALGDDGMSRLRRFEDYLRRFLEQTDAYLLHGTGFPIAEVRLRAPIPRPRLLWGLVQNSPAFWRHAPQRTHANLFPQGHQRPQGTVIGPGDPIVIPAESADRFGWNPELGVIIGRGGRDIPIDQAMAHVAGFTVITDAVPYFYGKLVDTQPNPLHDWFEDATGSWGDKKSDTMCPVGPYLTTPDEIGNPYDLLVISRQSGFIRDRSHTSAMLLGIERTISWLSTFRALLPGDIIHMASMGVDGLPTIDTVSLPGFHASGFGPDDFVESEIERVGTLRNRIVITGAQDWRSENDPTRSIHPVPAVRDLLQNETAALQSADDWHVTDANHFWTVFGNTHSDEKSGAFLPRPYPRFLNAPATALAALGSTIVLPRRAASVTISVELGCVVSRVASRVAAAEAGRYILGYVVLAAVSDSSFADAVIEPATSQERNLPAVYARWGDGFNVVSQPPVPLSPDEAHAHTCALVIEGIGKVEEQTSDYVRSAPEVLAFIAQQITLFPGDVITLGPLPGCPTIPAGHDLTGVQGRAAIQGIGEVTFTFDDRRASG